MPITAPSPVTRPARSTKFRSFHEVPDQRSARSRAARRDTEGEVAECWMAVTIVRAAKEILQKTPRQCSLKRR